MYYYNQRNYAKITYPSSAHKDATISSSGCGVCAVAMVINNLANKELYNIQQMRDLALSSKAREAEGTNINTLLNAIIRQHPEYSYKTTNSESDVVNHLKAGGLAIANQGDKYDVFSSQGHFVTLAGLEGNNINVLDPYMYSGKYNTKTRQARIIKATSQGCVVSPSEMGKATADRSPAYWLVSIKTVTQAPPAPAQSSAVRFDAGSNYKLTANLNVRTGADVRYSIKRVSSLTANGRANALYKQSGADAILKAGTIVTAQQVIKNDGDIWLKIPSGYICVYYKGNKYANWYK